MYEWLAAKAATLYPAGLQVVIAEAGLARLAQQGRGLTAAPPESPA